MKRQSDRPSHPTPNGFAAGLQSLSGRGWLQGLVLVAATFLAYQPAWHAGFIWDDDALLTDNPCIVGPLGFKAIWTSRGAIYFPLTLTSFWVQHTLWGLAPQPYHLVNIALHAACVLVLWRLLRGLGIGGAWLGAALWALHPVQVESVAWVAELKNTQSGLFYLLAVWFFLKWRAGRALASAQGNEWNYAVALLWTALALLSKSSTVMLPIVLGLVWWWQEGRWRWGHSLRLAPFLLISAAVSGWTIWEQKFRSGAAGSDWEQTLAERFIIAGKDLWFYLGKLLWPHPLIFVYPRWTYDTSQPLAYLPLLGAGVVAVVLWWNRHGWMRPGFLALAYFAVSLFPVLGFFDAYFFRYSFVEDHLQYLASMGPLALAAAGVVAGLGALKKGKPFLDLALCGTLLVALGVLTWRQSGTYADIETLWRSTIARNPDCWMAHYNLGVSLSERGQTDEANAQWQKALEIHPDFPEAHNNVGMALARKGKLDEAIGHFQKVLEIQPGFVEALNNLGLALAQKGEMDEAIRRFQRALEINPASAQAHYNLGRALYEKGLWNDAIVHCRKALEIQPDFAEAHNNLGLALLQSGKVNEAIVHYQRALEIKPDFVSALNNLAWMLATCPQASVRNGAKAIALAQSAARLSGENDPVILQTLAAAYAEAARFPEAVATAQQSLRLTAAQPNAALADALRKQLELYQAGLPLRDTLQTNSPSSQDQR